MPPRTDASGTRAHMRGRRTALRAAAGGAAAAAHGHICPPRPAPHTRHGRCQIVAAGRRGSSAAPVTTWRDGTQLVHRHRVITSQTPQTRQIHSNTIDRTFRCELRRDTDRETANARPELRPYGTQARRITVTVLANVPGQQLRRTLRLPSPRASAPASARCVACGRTCDRGRVRRR